MNAKVRRVVIGTAAISMAVSLAACGKAGGGDGGSGGDNKTIGLLLPENKTTRYETFDRPYMTDKIKSLCKDCKVKYNNANQDSELQKKQFDALIAQGVKTIILDAVDAQATKSWVDRAALSSAAASQFRLITGHAREAQEPVTRDSLFMRASWPDALVDDLDLTALARLNPYDGSIFSQFDAAWYLSNAWTAGLTLTASIGDGKSEYGIPAQKGSVQVRLVRYF